MADLQFYSRLSDSRIEVKTTVYLSPLTKNAFVHSKYNCTSLGHTKLKFDHRRLPDNEIFVENRLNFVKVYKQFESYRCLHEGREFLHVQRHLKAHTYHSQRNILITTITVVVILKTI